MRDPAARAALAEVYRAADERQRETMRRTLAIAGQRAALGYLDRVRRQQVAADLLCQGMTTTEAERVIAERFGCSPVTAWRVVHAASRSTAR